MQSFFTITSPVYTLSFMEVEVSWDDLPKRKSKKVVVHTKEEYIIQVLSIEKAALKDILKRYLNQRIKAEILPQHLVKEVKQLHCLNDLCQWVRNHKAQFINSLPREHSPLHNWRAIILSIIDFSEYYQQGDGRIAAINQIQTQTQYGRTT